MAEEKGIPEFVVMFSRAFPEPAVTLITEEDAAESETDTAVYVIARNLGEGCDRFNKGGDYLLSETEMANIAFVAEKYEKTIVVLNVANVIDTAWIQEIKGVNAGLMAGQAGNIGGFATVDVLLGETIPSGKLSDTWGSWFPVQF